MLDVTAVEFFIVVPILELLKLKNHELEREDPNQMVQSLG